MLVSVNRADRQRQLEADARTTFEVRAARQFNDAEWAAMRAKLVEFAGILPDWHRTAAGPRRGKVERLCQREL
jgi:hypothetical protein